MSHPESLASHWVLLFFLALLNKQMLAWSTDYASIERSSSRQDYIHRTWSEWTLWSACSRTCGGGVKMRTRICKIRIARSDSLSNICIGENVEYELCSIHNCSPRDMEFLEYQCSLRNGQSFGGRKIEEWIPFRYGSNPCELQCWSKDRTLMHSFGKAIDGTKCATSNPRDPAICIDGRCTAVDCAGQIGRDNKLDRCGVCRGNNSTCVHYQDIFWKRPRIRTSPDGSRDHYDYEKITVIPAGASEIIVEENNERNFLALMDDRGSYRLNGNWRIQSPGLFAVHGSEFHYNRTWDGSESLSALGPIRYDITIYVLGSGDIPTVYFEYWVSSNDPFKPPRSFQILNQIKNVDAYEPDKIYERQNSRYLQPENNHIHDDFSTKTTQFQGYKSYYHRNEILKSVPSWSVKRHRIHKNNIHLETQNDVLSNSNAAEINSRLSELNNQKETFEINKLNIRTDKSDEKNDPSFSRLNSHTRTFHADNYNNYSFIYKADHNHDGSTLKSAKNLKKFEYKENNFLSTITPIGQKKSVKVEQPLGAYRTPNPSLSHARTISSHTVTSQPKLYQNEINSKEKVKSENRRHSSTKGLKKSNGEKHKHNKRRRKSGDISDECSCIKPKEQKRNFCESEFVLRAVVLSTERQEHNYRYELQVIQSYKNKVPISPKEYIWTTDLCRCPKLRAGKEYIIMGHSGVSPNRRESRLLLRRNSFVRKYSNKRVRTMQRLVRDQNSICNNLK